MEESESIIIEVHSRVFINSMVTVRLKHAYMLYTPGYHTHMHIHTYIYIYIYI